MTNILLDENAKFMMIVNKTDYLTNTKKSIIQPMKLEQRNVQ